MTDPQVGLQVRVLVGLGLKEDLPFLALAELFVVWSAWLQGYFRPWPGSAGVRAYVDVLG
jgi:hypothetical protein